MTSKASCLCPPAAPLPCDGTGCDGCTPTPLPTGPFGTILADPPWSFSDKGSRIAPDFKRRPLYSTMTLEEILLLPVQGVAAPWISHLYLWVPSALLPQGLDVMRAWGFAYKTSMIWGKLTKHGKQAFGMGHYSRAAHEQLLVGVRGKAPLPLSRSRSERSLIMAPVGRHSAKPEAIQDAIERVSPGPRLELFARRARPGWTVWGNEAPEVSP